MPDRTRNVARPPRRNRGGLRFAATLVAWLTLVASGATLTTATAEPHIAARPPAAAPESHAEAEGGRLVATQGDTGRLTKRCRSDAPIRSFAVAAIGVEVTLNRFGDHDPAGRMFALESEIPRIRAEESRNRAERATGGAVSLGLQGDAIQPLTLRALPGECVRIRLRNALREHASLHLHGAALRLRDGSPAVATNAKALVAPGDSLEYEWAIPPSEPEGTHYFHSHGNAREQSSHGLFGAIVVEPADAQWNDPRTGKTALGWDAIIRPPSGPAFREFVLYYHEIGHENYRIRSGDGGELPLVDPLLSAYRPSARALNYRSEPFLHRMALQQRRTGRFDESLAYSSYAFGDPATPVLRSYLGDPVKQRVVHGGSEVAHVHHVHGGSIRWPRRPGLDPPRFALGPTKTPPLLPGRSERTDSQAIGPSETFDTENECGSGGCQASAGDFLVHCHVAHHYFAGMWGIWRVYNTLQSSGAQTDALPPLLPLPDRARAIAPGVRASQLAGKTIEYRGAPLKVADPVALAAAQLPPRGTPTPGDASLLEWRIAGGDVLGEPEAEQPWPGYAPSAPGTRPPILLDPRTGRLAYPFLRPHLGKRPPFAPGHGPSPFLEPAPPGTRPAGPEPPGAAGPGSICPVGTRLKTFRVNAIGIPVPLNVRENLVDPDGQLYVLAEDEPAIRRDPSRRVPLVIRANAQEDCVDIVFATSLPDAPITHGFAKANMHVHFVQFDVQGSDGVVTGFNFEQSVRPYTLEGERLAAPSRAGDRALAVRGSRFRAGALVAIGIDTPRAMETRTVVAASPGSITLDRPLSLPHAAGEIVSSEFVRYRWYPDAQTGTAYFHDHVNALNSWRHGLFGALVVEPPGSTYHDPRTGAQIRSGAIADIHTTARVSADVVGSFREVVLMLMDDVPITSSGRSLGGAINMRAEPLSRRPEAAFDGGRAPPETPTIEANIGDPVVLRTLVAATNDVHTLHVSGHWFRAELHDDRSPPVAAVRVGISERFDLVLPAAGGPQRLAGDYRYAAGRRSKLREGSWGILRVLPAVGSPLRPLPGREVVAAATTVCPVGSPPVVHDVALVDAPPPSGSAMPPRARMLVVARDRGEALARAALLEPLVLRAATGQCLDVRITNHTSRAVALAADLLAYDPRAAGARSAHPPVVAPAASAVYRFYASPEIGERVAILRDVAGASSAFGDGVYGAIVVGPEGVRYTDPSSGRPVSSGAIADAATRDAAWRDAVVFFADDDGRMGTHQMPYQSRVGAPAGIGYRAEPLQPRRERSAHPFARPPSTPRIRAYAGDPLRFHVIAASSEQTQVFSLEGHRWRARQAGGWVSSESIGGAETITAEPAGGAGGGDSAAFLYANHREPFREAGMWGVLEALDPCRSVRGLRRLAGVAPAGGCGGSPLIVLVALAGLATLGGVRIARRRHASSRASSGSLSGRSPL